MRETEPFDLGVWWLEPGKVITDPIHGDIFVTRLEQILLDTPPMQRLRRVRQLGTTHLVYPGASHTRFSHSLGALRVVQTLLDVAVGQRDSHHPVPDLFEEWLDEAEKGGDTKSVEKKIAEATVLARLGALLHDLGHLSFGHTVEDDLELLTPHDENESRFRRMWEQMLDAAAERVETDGTRREEDDAVLQKRIADLERLRPDERLHDQRRRPGEVLHDQLKALVLSSRKDENGKRIDPATLLTEYPFVADMVGNTICADLLDYLQRDHRFTGLPISLGQRYLSSFYITPDQGHGIYGGRMALRIHRNGRERQDVITEILKHLRYRYELQERVLVHHLKLTADAMIGKMIELWHGSRVKQIQELSAVEQARLLSAVDEDFTCPSETSGERASGEGAPQRIANWELEQLFLAHGDDGLLEHLSEIDPKKEGSARASAAARSLASDVLDRRLYRHAADAANAYAAQDLHAKFGPAAVRRELESEAARHAELEHDWHVILWVPGPGMRLKLAELLVDHGKGIAKFKDYSPLGSDIYNAHRALWRIGVFTHPAVTDKQTRAVLASLAQQLGVCWDAHERLLGSDPESWPRRLAAMEVFDVDTVDDRVRKLVARSRSIELAARGAEPETHGALVKELWAQAEAEGLEPPPL